MPEFIAVQCFQCSQYQVAQKRKDNKFSCKLCGSKQSVRKVAARSNKAADVRKFVQQINLVRGRAEEQFDDLQAVLGCDGDGLRERDREGIPKEISNSVVTSQSYARAGDHAFGDDACAEPSRWAPYAAVLAHGANDEACRRDCKGGEDEEVHRNVEEGGGEFVTTLPDAQRGKTGKKKSLKEAGRSSSRARKKRHYATHEDARSSGEVDQQEEGAGPPMRVYNGPAVKNLRNDLRNVSTREERGPHIKRSRWQTSSALPRAANSADDFGDGTFTTLGHDEAVTDEVYF